MYWPIRIKEIIQWFDFHPVVDHTAGIIETNISLIPLLLEGLQCFIFFYFKINIMKRRKKKGSIFITCINYDRRTGLKRLKQSKK